MNVKKTYIHRIIHTYLNSSFSFPLMAAIGKWLTNGKDDDIKDEALFAEWHKCSSANSDIQQLDDAFAKYSTRPHNTAD